MNFTQRFATSVLAASTIAWGLGACAPATVEPVETAQTADSVPVPATGLRMVPPAGWVPAEEFVGYLSKESRGSIMVTEMPGPFAQASLGFKQKEVMAKAGMELLSVEEVDQGLYPGLFLRISQEVYGTQVEKWGWVFGNGAETVMVMGTCYDEKDLPLVKASIESVQWDPNVKYEEPGGIGFEIDPGKLVSAERMGKMLLYTSDGGLDLERVGKPVFMLGPAMNSGPIQDHKAFIERRARDFPYEYGETRSNEATEIDGLPGYTLVASVINETTKRPMTMHLTVLFEVANYWILLGTCSSDLDSESLPVFKAATESFTRTK